jgi:hypothetical protein
MGSDSIEEEKDLFVDQAESARQIKILPSFNAPSTQIINLQKVDVRDSLNCIKCKPTVRFRPGDRSLLLPSNDVTHRGSGIVMGGLTSTKGNFLSLWAATNTACTSVRDATNSKLRCHIPFDALCTPDSSQFQCADL